jgi:hypothetical protein
MKTCLIPFLTLLTGISFALFHTDIQAQTPAPDAFFKFDEESGTKISDSSGNKNDGLWYNILNKQPGHLGRSGWKPQNGYRGGAAYLAGDHVLSPKNCPDPLGGDCTCSSGTDLLIFAPSVTKDASDKTPVCFDNGLGESKILHSGFASFTLAFWYRNMWDYFCASSDPKHYSYDDDSSCASERQVLWSMGDGTKGITIEVYPHATYNALLKATINGGFEGGAKELVAISDSILFNAWTHISVTFKGNTENNTGLFSLYLDGKFQKSIVTAFDSIPADETAAVFGGESNGSVTGKSVNVDCWGNVDYLLCGITAEFYNTVRYGWLARGYLDELAIWKDKALTEEEILKFARIGDTSVGVNDIPLDGDNKYQIIPSPVKDFFRIGGFSSEGSNVVSIFNIDGKLVKEINNVCNDQQIAMPASLPNGVYLVRIAEDFGAHGSCRFILNR